MLDQCPKHQWSPRPLLLWALSRSLPPVRGGYFGGRSRNLYGRACILRSQLCHSWPTASNLITISECGFLLLFPAGDWSCLRNLYGVGFITSGKLEKVEWSCFSLYGLLPKLQSHVSSTFSLCLPPSRTSFHLREFVLPASSDLYPGSLIFSVLLCPLATLSHSEILVCIGRKARRWSYSNRPFYGFINLCPPRTAFGRISERKVWKFLRLWLASCKWIILVVIFTFKYVYVYIYMCVCIYIFQIFFQLLYNFFDIYYLKWGRQTQFRSQTPPPPNPCHQKLHCTKFTGDWCTCSSLSVEKWHPFDLEDSQPEEWPQLAIGRNRFLLVDLLRFGDCLSQQHSPTHPHSSTD